MMSSLFLFGAGASAFSGGCLPGPPPLGTHLFAELLKLNGVAARLSDELKARFLDFEQGMLELRHQNHIELVPLLREMAVYFAQFEPLQDNLYVRLIAGLGHRRPHVVLSTLNYDLLLEHAANINGSAVTYGGLPVESNNMSVLKLHGSCNFLPVTAPLKIRNIHFAGPPESRASLVEGPVRPGTPEDVLRFCTEEDSLAPAIALYAPGKQVLHSGQFVATQQRAWRHAVQAAREIFVVGVRVNVSDSHIWDPLARAKAPVWYVGPDASEFDAWRKNCRCKSKYHLAPTFADALPLLVEKASR